MPEMGKKMKHIFRIINDYVTVINKVLIGRQPYPFPYLLFKLLSWQS